MRYHMNNNLALLFYEMNIRMLRLAIFLGDSSGSNVRGDQDETSHKVDRIAKTRPRWSGSTE